MKKRFVSGLLVLALALSLVGGALAAEKTIGFISGAPHAPFFKMVEDGLRRECEANGWELLVGYGANEKVLENGRLFIAQGVDAIVNFGVTTNTGETLLEEATAANIPVVDVDVDCGGYYFGANNEMAGAVLGEALADYLKDVPDLADKKMKAVLFWNGNEGEAVRKRLTGVIKGLNERGITNLSADNNYENDTIVWQNVQDDSTVKELAKNQISALAEESDLLLLVMVGDFMGTGAVAAISETGLDKRRVLVVSHNESQAFADNLKDENTPWIASTAYRPEAYGDYIVNRILLPLFNGEEVERLTLMEHVAITRDNINDFFPGTIE